MDRTFLLDQARLGWKDLLRLSRRDGAVPLQPEPRREAAVRRGEQMSLPPGRRWRGGGKGLSAVGLAALSPRRGKSNAKPQGPHPPDERVSSLLFRNFKAFAKKKKAVTRICGTVASTMST